MILSNADDAGWWPVTVVLAREGRTSLWLACGVGAWGREHCDLLAASDANASIL
jgi:hypothetical protein